MKTLHYRFAARLTFSAPVTEHVFSLRCLPMQDAVQTLQSAQVELTPACPFSYVRDGFGSAVLCGSLSAEHTDFCYCSTGTARVDLAAPPAREANPALRHPGAMTRPDAALRDFWAALPLAGESPLRQCELLSRAVSEHFAYTPGATTAATAAAQAFALGRGVCQDYAQVLAVLARLSGFAARYCMGLAPGEGATHAWTEIFLPGRGWVGFDPTRRCAADESYLRFAVGRDAADCPAERGTFRGCADQTQLVQMKLTQTEE